MAKTFLDAINQAENNNGPVISVPDGTITLVDTASVQTLTNQTLTGVVLTGATNQGTTPVNVTTTPVTLSAATHGGKITTMSLASGVAFTLPAATGSGVEFQIATLITLTSATATIKVANAQDYMIGLAYLMQDGGDTISGFATANSGTVATESDTITLTGATWTTGGIKGGQIRLVDIAANIWLVSVSSDAANAEATPFSATV